MSGVASAKRGDESIFNCRLSVFEKGGSLGRLAFGDDSYPIYAGRRSSLSFGTIAPGSDLRLILSYTRFRGEQRMMCLQDMIDELSTRADYSELIALLATSRQARRDNAALARELRDVVGALKRELHQRQGSALRQLAEIRVRPPEMLAH